MWKKPSHHQALDVQEEAAFTSLPAEARWAGNMCPELRADTGISQAPASAPLCDRIRVRIRGRWRRRRATLGGPVFFSFSASPHLHSSSPHPSSGMRLDAFEIHLRVGTHSASRRDTRHHPSYWISLHQHKRPTGDTDRVATAPPEPFPDALSQGRAVLAGSLDVHSLAHPLSSESERGWLPQEAVVCSGNPLVLFWWLVSASPSASRP